MHRKVVVLILLVLFVSIGFLESPSLQSSAYHSRTEAPVHLSVEGGNLATSIADKSPLAFKIEFFTDPGLTHQIRNGRAIEGSTLYLDVVLVDSHRKPVDFSGSGLLLVTLSISAGAISATNVYITPGHSDTQSSFGGILWVLPSTAGLRISIDSSASYNGKLIFGAASLTTIGHR
jgi:hypothetical protein